MQGFTLLGDIPHTPFLQGRALPYSYFLRREERSKEASGPSARSLIAYMSEASLKKGPA